MLRIYVCNVGQEHPLEAPSTTPEPQVQDRRLVVPSTSQGPQFQGQAEVDDGYDDEEQPLVAPPMTFGKE